MAHAREPVRLRLTTRRSLVFLLLTAAAVSPARASAFTDFVVGISSYLSGPVPVSEIVPDVPVDAISPLVDPLFVPAATSAYGEDEVVVGVALAGEAFTYSDLEAAGVVNQIFGGDDIVIFYQPAGRLALGYSRRMAGDVLHFALAGDGAEGAMALFVDAETGSTWNLNGEAVAGPLAGEHLAPVGTCSAYWFGWASFWPQTQIWDGSSLEPSTAVEPSTAIEDSGWGQLKATAAAAARHEETLK